MDIEKIRKAICDQAEQNAGEYAPMYRKVARVAFTEGAMWLAAELAAHESDDKEA